MSTKFRLIAYASVLAAAFIAPLFVTSNAQACGFKRFNAAAPANYTDVYTTASPGKVVVYGNVDPALEAVLQRAGHEVRRAGTPEEIGDAHVVVVSSNRLAEVQPRLDQSRAVAVVMIQPKTGESAAPGTRYVIRNTQRTSSKLATVDQAVIQALRPQG